MSTRKKPGHETPAEIPLTPAVFNILLCLVDGEKHGYAIMQEIASRTNGRLRIGPGTLYGCIQRMIAVDLIEENADDDPEQGHSKRRGYYRITRNGRQVAASEAQRLSELVYLAERLRLIPRTS